MSRYLFRVGAHLDDHWSARLGGLTVTRHADGTSTLVGPVRDQAQLHGILAGLRDIGVVLVELRRLDPDRAAPHHRAGGGHQH